MRDQNPEPDISDVLKAFEALARGLDQLLAKNAANGADPEVATRIERARALAVRGSAIVNEHLNRHPT